MKRYTILEGWGLWIKKGWGGCCCVALGCWGIVTEAAVCSNVIICLWLQGAVSSVLASSNFQYWGQAQKRKMTVIFNKFTGLLGKWCHNSKWGWLCPFTYFTICLIKKKNQQQTHMDSVICVYRVQQVKDILNRLKESIKVCTVQEVPHFSS